MSRVPAMLDLQQAAALFNISERTIIRWASEGKVPAFRRGRTWRFPTKPLEELLGFTVLPNHIATEQTSSRSPQ